MAYASRIARDALRSALRSAVAVQGDDLLAGRRVNDLTLDVLRSTLNAMGLDPAAIVADALKTDSWATAEEAMTETEAAPDTIEPEPETAEVPDPIEIEVQTIRSLIVSGGFSALDDRLRELVAEARKPAIEVRVEVPAASCDPVPGGGGVVPSARPTGKSATWRNLFGVKDRALSQRETQLWDGAHPSTPKINDRYMWPQPQTAVMLSQIARGRNVMAFGPPGTGKTEWAQQLAAVTGRPFALISCDNGTDAATLVGMTVPDASGGVTWQDGQLTRAIKTPGCVVCIDEPSLARPGALFVMGNVLANRMLFVAETGARVCVAPGVVFVAADNTNGTGGGARRGLTDTNRLNAAFLDRFGVIVKFEYLAPEKETALVAAYTGCTVELARLLVGAATLTRVAAEGQTLSQGIGFRRLVSWAELLTDGVDAETAFAAAVLDGTPEADAETLREQCLLSYDKATVAAALNPPSEGLSLDPRLDNPTPAGRSAASDFTPV